MTFTVSQVGPIKNGQRRKLQSPTVESLKRVVNILQGHSAQWEEKDG